MSVAIRREFTGFRFHNRRFTVDRDYAAPCIGRRDLTLQRGAFIFFGGGVLSPVAPVIMAPLRSH